MLLKNPNYSNNKYYNDLLILSKKSVRLEALPCIGVLIKGDGKIIQSNTFCTYLSEMSTSNTLPLSSILGKNTLFPDIVYPLEYLKGWDKFLEIQKVYLNDKVKEIADSVGGCGDY